MSILARTLNLAALLQKKSFYLFGPRSTGKSFLIRQQLEPATPVINLLRSDLYLRLSANPSELESIITAYPQHEIVVIDEIQRIPMLLHEVHRLIEEQHIKFLLTGSSARKLHQQGVNLLAGRAWQAELFPLTSHEIPDFNLDRYLRYGGLPPVYLSHDPIEELHAYVNTYLKEEIQAESLVRKIPAFSRFLQTSALTSGTMLNFASIASDTGTPLTTVRDYYQILTDTFLGFMLPPWQKTIKRKAITTAKFYYFDLGVKNTLAGISELDKKSNLYGHAFEHFIALELRAYLSYRRCHQSLSYWRSKHGYEVDFIVGDTIAIEVKTCDKIHDKHLTGLQKLQEEGICSRYLCISFDKVHRKIGNIEAIYWQDFLCELWEDRLVKER